MPETTEIKAGWKTTEFWLATVATLISIAYASGVISDGSSADKIVGFLAASLASLGYSVSRSLAKR